MPEAKRFLFGPFRLEPGNRRLYRGTDEVPLRPKTFAVLQHLVEHAGRLLKKDELLNTAWRDTAVTDSVLKVSIRELREALEDDAADARFIQTEHGVGYRFIGAVSTDNLPIELTTLVGRDDDAAALTRMLLGHRLVTLTGPGGVGKSRLALRIARTLIDRYGDGVCWVELASLSDASLVAQTVASTLGVRSDAGGGFERSLQRHLRTQELLLVLDNCEHVIDACATLVSGLLRACERVRILTTSREPLGSSGEQVWNVQPLACPGVDASSAIDVVSYEAVRLFTDRASAVAPGFAATDSNAGALAEICRRLDGIPLAIELASTRVRALSVQQIAARLDHCFELLVRGNRGELPRHQTLMATIDWSVGLLSQAEQDLFVALAVFSGGWSVDAAEVVCEQVLHKAGTGFHETIIDLLVRLVEKSLVVAPPSDVAAEGRYRFLETVRQYARAKLLTNEEQKTAALQERHARYYQEFAEAIEPHINTSSRADWVGRLDVEYDNLRTALGWGLTHNPELALRLVASLRWFWFHRGYWTEGRTWLDRAVSANESPAMAAQTSMRARALLGTGILAWTQGDRLAARPSLEESVTLSRALEDQHLLAESTHFLANEILAEGDAGTAHSLAHESVALYRRIGQDAFGLAVTLATAGIAAMSLEQYRAAREALEESAALSRHAGDKWALSLALRNLGIVAFRHDDTVEAKKLLRESLAVLRDLRERWFISRCLETLAAIAALEGDGERAARLFGAGEILREALGASVLPAYRPDYDRGLRALRTVSSENEIQRAWRAGRKMTLDEALQYASADDVGTDRSGQST